MNHWMRSFGWANFLSAVCTFGTDCTPSPKTTIGVYAAVLHAAGTTSLVITILARAPTHQSADFVFRTFIDVTALNGSEGWGTHASHGYICVIGMLMAQYTLTGFYASARLTETQNAAMAGAIGVITAIGVSAILGWFLILGASLFHARFRSHGRFCHWPTGAQIFLDTVGEKAGIVLMVIVIGAMHFCGTFSITSNRF
ncbi:hypothetical protein PAXINDRAFT_178303 [Paxillus involutus ATCC 200175]|nr:hypothetical protein PAXINDRAFT_178303 [Paxillus involutus ATCC 200175]